MSKLGKELKTMDVQSLALKLDDLRRELFSIRLQAATSTIKDKMQFKKLRKDIARALTYLRQKV